MSASDDTSSQAWVTLATNDAYATGALVLAHSLVRAGTTRKKVVMVSGGIKRDLLDALHEVFDDVQDVALLDSLDTANLALLERPELGVTFTKLHCWNLTKYSKCVFLDADTLVIRHCDELFDREELSAAPDAGWPDCFNSGVFVYRPSVNTFKALMSMANEQGSFDGGDQGLLNMFFRDWMTKDIGKHLSFLYNMCATATYTYLPAYKYFGHDVKIVHFIGASKPWHVQFDPAGKPLSRSGEEHANKHLMYWWQIFHSDVSNKNADGGSSQPDRGSASGNRREEGPAHDQGSSAAGAAGGGGPSGDDRRERWEGGQPDYMGSASFDNILKKLESTMSTPDK